MKNLIILLSFMFSVVCGAQTYIQGKNLIEVPATTATAAGTTTLTVASQTNQQFTGSTTQTVVLPVATTLQNGHRFYITNRSSGTVTVNYSDSSLAQAITAGNQATLILVSNATAVGTWDVSYFYASIPPPSANIFLSNLNNPTAINTDLTFVGSGDIKSPSSNTGTSGSINIRSGPTTGGYPTGNIGLFTGISGAPGSDTGTINIVTGATTASGAGGNINIRTGTTASSARGGYITLEVGAGGDGPGTIRFVDTSVGTIGHVWTSTAVEGSGHWAAPVLSRIVAGTGLVPTTITSNGTLNVDVGTAANQIVQLTSLDVLPAVDGSLLTNLSVSNTQTISSNYTLLTSDGFILTNTNAGALTISFPNPATAQKSLFRIKDNAGLFGTNNVYMAPFAGEKIEGLVANLPLSANWGNYAFKTDGTNWYKVSAASNLATKLFLTSTTFAIPAGVTVMSLTGRGAYGGGGGGASGAGGSTVAAGGGGGSGAPGCSGASMTPQPVIVTPGVGIVITIGAHGTGGAGGVHALANINGALAVQGAGGTDGGNTTFGSLQTWQGSGGGFRGGVGATFGAAGGGGAACGIAWGQGNNAGLAGGAAGAGGAATPTVFVYNWYSKPGTAATSGTSGASTGGGGGGGANSSAQDSNAIAINNTSNGGNGGNAGAGSSCTVPAPAVNFGNAGMGGGAGGGGGIVAVTGSVGGDGCAGSDGTDGFIRATWQE